VRKWSGVALLLASAAVLGALVGSNGRTCQPWPQCRRTPTPSVSPTLSPTPSPSPVLTKSIPTGLSTSGFSWPFYTTEYDVATLNVYWDQIEPTQGQKTIEPVMSTLDAAQEAGVLSVRIRPFLGARAPTWAKALGDGPIDYIHPASGSAELVPDIWSPEYQAAVESLVSFLAEHLDADPRVRLVFATGGMLQFGEPFIRGTAAPENRAAFLAAGYTKAADAAVQKWQLDAMGVFQFTPIGLAYNPWQFVNADGTAGSSVAYMAEVMDYHSALYAERAVLTNHSIRESFVFSTPSFYAEFRSRPDVAHQFQTAARERIGDLRSTLDWGIDYLGASVIETYAGAWNELTPEEIQAYDERLAANA